MVPADIVYSTKNMTLFFSKTTLALFFLYKFLSKLSCSRFDHVFVFVEKLELEVSSK